MSVSAPATRPPVQDSRSRWSAWRHPAKIEQRAGEGAGVAALISVAPALVVQDLSSQGRRMVAVAMAAMPSSRPVNPSRFLVVAIHGPTREGPRR